MQMLLHLLHQLRPPHELAPHLWSSSPAFTEPLSPRIPTELMMVLCGVALLALLVSVQSLTRDRLFDYGIRFGDRILGSGSDSVRELDLEQPIYFFKGNFLKLYVNTNGFVSLAVPGDESEYLGKMPASFGMIAAFLGDLDTTDGAGYVYFRQDKSPDVLQRAADHISQAFPNDDGIEPTHAVIVTWENVAAQGQQRGDGIELMRNTFQLVVANMDLASYAILLYPEEQMQFISTLIEDEDVQVEVGFSEGLVQGWFGWSKTQGTYYRITEDSEESVRALALETNSGRPGVWVFEIGTSPLFTSIMPGEVMEVTPEGIDEPEPPVLQTRLQPSEAPYEPLTSRPELLSESSTPDELQYRYVPPQNPQNPQVLIIDEDELSVNVFSYNYETCSSNKHKCSTFAECRDYSDGYCCHCIPGYYGNGKDCIAEGKPQRMNGKLNGRLFIGNSPSPVEFSNNDLHSYVVANDGRAYIAVSSIPANVGASLQPLTALGEAIGWAFALEQPNYRNGFSLIGGVFTRQAEVTFLPGNERLTIRQEFGGIDEHDHLVVSTHLDGRIPEVPKEATVQIPPYNEIYQYSSNLITSSSRRDYTVSMPDGSISTHSYLWTQSIRFQSCPHEELTHSTPASQQLSVDQIFVMYDSSNQLIRFAMSNKIGSIHSGIPEQNPCFTGRHGCDTNAVCHPAQGKVFTCECATGFTGDGRVCYELERPVDHCQRGTHDCDAPERSRCSYSGDSTYICSCLPGFSGDGRVCHDVDECQPGRCHSDAVCFNTQGSFTCQCRPGFHGDGFSCTPGSDGEMTVCERHRASVLASVSSSFRPRPALGQFVPSCDGYGEYEPLQCHSGLDQCWCVDAAGREIPGSRAQPGHTPTCIDHNVAPPLIGPTPRSDIIAPPPGANILFAQSGRIELLPLDGGHMSRDEARTLLHVPGKVVIAVAFDCVEQMVYWSDITQPAISRAAAMKGGQTSVIINRDLGSPEGLAVDPVSRRLFWTDSVLDRIEVSQLDGSDRRLLFDSDLINPRPIIADPAHRLLYWADWNRDGPKIERSSLDGSGRTVLVRDGLALPNALTFDPQSRQLCWADAGTRRVECVDPVSGVRRKLSDGIQYPFAMATDGRKLYYTDWRREAVVAMDRHDGREVEEFLPQRRSRTYGITVTYPQCPAGVLSHMTGQI
ncbi:nidogen-1-like isoform X2 [Pseudorasbora parva]|uniref:nidogen-1-like isoform X2 n=1 Tax=Pseudorasbora parva TaxID=51549 RepID=UPI00351ED77F